MRQQIGDAAGWQHRQALEHILHVAVRVMAIEPRRVQQAHHRSGTLTGTQAAGE
jgi:hypothetical protein